MARPKQLQPNPFSGLLNQSGQARSKPEQIPAEASVKTTGRRSRSDYIQVAGYVPADLYRKVKRRLFEEEQNFSELLERWMIDYVGKQ